MGLNWNKAFSNAFETGAALVGDSIRRDRDMANRSELMRINDELDQQKAARANVAAVERHEAIRESDLKSADTIRSKKMSEISAIEERLRGDEAAANYRTKYNDPEVQAANIDAGARGILADSSPRGMLARRARAMQEYGDVEGAYKLMQGQRIDDQNEAALKREANNEKKIDAMIKHGGVGGSGDPSKGAQYDVDDNGYRVILYRDGTMVYPKDESGNPVKIKAGTDLDKKFTRDVILKGESKRFAPPDEDVVKRAEELTARTSGKNPQISSFPPGIPPGSKQIGTSKGVPVYESPDGKRYIAE